MKEPEATKSNQRSGEAGSGSAGHPNEHCEKCEEFLAGWKQALADYDNLKKDLDKERDFARDSIREDLALKLIPILDNFSQANRYVPDLKLKEEEAMKLQNWLQGMQMVEAQLVGVMNELGLEEVKSEGMFDPECHEAVEERTVEGKMRGEILDVLQAGWKLNQKIIRPAKVVVNTLS